MEKNFIELNLSGKPVVVKKLPLGKISLLIGLFKDLPEELKSKVSNIDQIDNDVILQEIPTLIALAMPHMAKFVAVACNSKEITEEYLLEEAGFDDAVDIVNAILEVNNIAGILEKVKKTQALYQKIRPAVAPAIQNAQAKMAKNG
jgi:hypothetical protein